MAIKLYSTAFSPPCQAIILLAKYLGLELEILETSPLAGDTKKPEYLEMNPQHVIPTLVDEDGFVIWESRTIARYLVQKYGKDDSLYPKDLKKRTDVDKILDFDLGTLYKRLIDYIIPLFPTGRLDETAVPKLEDSLTVVETLLGKSENGFIVANQFTIADIVVFFSVNCLKILNFDLQNYPLINQWLSTVKATVSDYDKIGVPLEEEFGNFFLPLLK